LISHTGAPKALGVAALLAISLLASTGSAELTAQAHSETRVTAAPTGAADDAVYLDWIVLARHPGETEAEPAPWPPEAATVIASVQAKWPEDRSRAVGVLLCESKAGQDDRTYDLNAENGGPMQINKATWASYFEAVYGWTWEQVVTDLDIHMAAARHIYDRSNGWFAWNCW
jgi:hypothetical protein